MKYLGMSYLYVNNYYVFNLQDEVEHTINFINYTSK